MKCHHIPVGSRTSVPRECRGIVDVLKGIVTLGAPGIAQSVFRNQAFASEWAICYNVPANISGVKKWAIPTFLLSRH
jgi:hypothetical protein